MDNELLQELQIELGRLNESIQSMRAEGYTQNDIEQTTNLFEGEWLERLTQDQRAETRGAVTGIELAYEERYNQADMDRRDAGKLEGMTPEGQIAFWSANRTGDGVYRATQRAETVAQVVTQAQKQISSEYNNLRYGLVKSIQEIEAGRPSSLTRVIAAAVEKDGNAPEPNSAQVQKPQARPEPEPEPEKQAEPEKQVTPDKMPVPRLSHRPPPETWLEYQTRQAQKQPDQERSAQTTELDQAQEIQKEMKRER